MHEQYCFSERRSIPSLNHRLRTIIQFLSCTNIMKSCTRFFYNQSTKYPMLLVHICIQMIVEKYRLQFFFREKSFHKCFILSGPGNIIPSICGPIRYNRIKLHQMNMKSYDIRKRLSLKRTRLNIFRKQICETHFNTVARICTDDKRFRANLAFLDLFDKCIESALFFQCFFPDKEPSLRIVPAILIIHNLRLHKCQLK